MVHLRKLLIVAAVALAAACGNGGGGKGKGDRPPPLVKAEPATSMRFAETIEAVGTANANEQVTITAQVTERLVRLGFDDGSFVRRGQTIAVLSQGGYVVDLERNEVLRTVGLPRDVAVRVIERIESVAGDLVVAVEDAAEQAEAFTALRVQHGFDWPYPEPAHLLPKHEVLPSGAVLKVFLRSSTLGQDELLARAKRVVDPVDAEVTHAGLGFIEVLPPGITKATGLAIALERYGVGFGDVLVFGDMPNDLPMITAVADAGGRAIAVANAHPTVHAATTGVTSGHDADGVARYLEALFSDDGVARV